MQISFNGIKNITAIYKPQNEKNGIFTLSMQLTNDENGNDLDEYRNILKKHPNSNKFAHPYDNRFINLNLIKDDSDGIYEKDTYINEYRWEINPGPEDQEHKINDKILPMFTFINKLTQKIYNTPEKEFVYDEEFINIKKIVAFLDLSLLNEATERFQTPEEQFEYIYNETYFPYSQHSPYRRYTDSEILNQITNIQDIKKCAKEINKGIHEQMCEYFDVQG